MSESNTVAVAGLVDFHCHLDLYPDHLALVQESDAAGIFTLAVTTTPKAWPRNHELAQRTRHVRVALGLHPQLVAERANELDLWDHYLEQTRYIGEVGLDAGPRFYKSLDLQKRVFRHVLQSCAESGDKILTVHSVRAVKSVLDEIEAYFPPTRGKVVLHWFTGTKAEAARALKLGCYFSINASMLENERHLEMVKSLPMDRVLTETDGPFTKTGTRPSRPADVALVVNQLANIYGRTPAETATAVRHHLRKLLEPAE